MIKLISVSIFLIIALNVNAQQESSDLKTSKAQITFAYPLGSHGSRSLEYSNKFSFNVLYGVNGGLDGFEFGSILNYIKGDAHGVQISGVANIVGNEFSGFQLGVLNYAKSFKGFQLGTINIVENEMSRFQLGVINYAKKLKGVQLGVINILNDAQEGLPIGILNIVKNGYFEIELTTSETIYSNINYKMGVEKFYTIFKVGYSSYQKNPVTTYGFGFGRNFILSKKQKISLDLSSSSILYKNKRAKNTNLLNKADLNYKYALSKKLSLLVGASLNVYVTGEKVDGVYGTLEVPYTIYNNETSNNKLFIWVGFNAGVSFHL